MQNNFIIIFTGKCAFLSMVRQNSEDLAAPPLSPEVLENNNNNKKKTTQQLLTETVFTCWVSTAQEALQRCGL